MFSAAQILIAILPFCSGSPLADECNNWMFQCVNRQQVTLQSNDIGFYTEDCVENLPQVYWEK